MILLFCPSLSPYKFYQYMFAVPDADVGRFMRRLTFMPLADIEAFERAMADPATYEVNSAQKRLAAEVTRFVHGEAGLAAALRATQGLAPGAATVLDAETLESLAADVPTVQLARAAAVGVTVAELAVAAGLQPSKGAAKKLIKGGGVYINNAKVADEAATVAEADAIDGRLILLACGKKNKCLIRITG
jgi:tyrosyl-tRNA synthetase